MKMNISKTLGTTFPQSKIRKVVRTALPKGKDFKLHVANSSIDNMKIVRIVTPAWKSLSPSTRIRRVLQAVNSELSVQELEGILRFSVLTPEEYRELVLRRPRPTKPMPLQKSKPQGNSLGKHSA